MNENLPMKLWKVSVKNKNGKWGFYTKVSAPTEKEAAEILYKFPIPPFLLTEMKEEKNE